MTIAAAVWTMWDFSAETGESARLGDSQVAVDPLLFLIFFLLQRHKQLAVQ